MNKGNKAKRNHSKKLHRGKKLEATKPLDVPVHTTTTSSGPSESLSLNFTKIEYKN